MLTILVSNNFHLSCHLVGILSLIWQGLPTLAISALPCLSITQGWSIDVYPSTIWSNHLSLTVAYNQWLCICWGSQRMCWVLRLDGLLSLQIEVSHRGHNRRMWTLPLLVTLIQLESN